MKRSKIKSLVDSILGDDYQIPIDLNKIAKVTHNTQILFPFDHGHCSYDQSIKVKTDIRYRQQSTALRD